MNAPQPKLKAETPTLVQRALGGHAALGLLASGLLYLIALSGTLIVIHDRWQRWETPGIAEARTITPAVAEAALKAGLAVDAGKPATTHLYLRMPDDDLPRPVVTTDHGGHYADAQGRIIAEEGHAWTEFLIQLHEYLHLPMTLGLIVVGALGVALAALVVTGVAAHPRIFRDAFRLRARHDGQVARADWHNRIGVWTLPFALTLALTGAVIGLGSVGYQVLATAYFGGDVEKAYAPIFGHEGPPDAAPAPFPAVATALANLAAQAPGVRPTYIIVHDPLTRGQHIQIIAAHPRRLIYGETYKFDAAGRPHGKVGLSDGPLGQQAAASTYNLHFGNYAGLPVELAYMVMGLGLCVVTATGTSLWLQKRARRGLPSARLAAGWAWVVWGTPLLLVGAFWVRTLAGNGAPLVPLFWLGLGAGLAASMSRPGLLGHAALRKAVPAAVLATAVFHLLWLRPGEAASLVIDVGAILLAGAWLLVERRRAARD